MSKLLSMGSIQKIIGSRVRILRQQQKTSLESLASKAGISYQYLSGIETGKENFTVQVLESTGKGIIHTRSVTGRRSLRRSFRC